MQSKRLSIQRKISFLLGSSWRKKVLPKSVNEAIWKRINDISSYEEHARQITSHEYSFDQNINVPEDYQVHMRGLWLIELFPSSYSEDLFYQLDKSGWDGVHAYAMNDDPNSEKAREARAKKSIRWWRLGIDKDKKCHRLIPDCTSLDLPCEFELVEYKAIQIGSSLTAVSAFFSPTDEYVEKLSTEWHTNHEPILLKTHGKRPQAFGRLSSDIYATQLARHEMYESARKWMSKRCGGFFSKNGHNIPAADLLLFEGIDPVKESMNKRCRDADRALGIDGVFHWVSAEMPSLAVVPYEDSCSNYDFIGIVGNTKKTVEPIVEHLEMYGNNEEHAISYHYADHVQDILLQVCIQNYTNAMLEKYAKRRDTAYKEYKKHRSKKTEELRFEMLTDSLDIKEAALDASLLWEPVWRKWNGLEDLKMVHSPRCRSDDESSNRTIDLLEEFNVKSKKNFDLLLDRDSAYRDILATASSIGADNINTRLSRIAIIVAFISLIVAIITLCSPLIRFQESLTMAGGTTENLTVQTEIADNSFG